mgnify:FL=1
MDNQIDIHKLIDEAMEKKDRYVSIYIGEFATTVSVHPTQGKAMWLHDNDGRIYCSSCGNRSRDCGTYCSFCGEEILRVRSERKEE